MPTTSPDLTFSVSKPATAGRYLWRLPESEKPGFYTLAVLVTKDRADPARGLIIVTDEGDEICTLAEDKGGRFRKSWRGRRAISRREAAAANRDDKGGRCPNLNPDDLKLISGDEMKSYFVGSLEILGTPFNVEMVEVEPGDGATRAVNPALQNRIDGVSSFDDGGDSYCTVIYQRRRWFVVIIPHQD